MKAIVKKVIRQIFTKKVVDNISSHPYYPNSWGRENYEGQRYSRLHQENLSIYSSKSNAGWVSAYANKHLKGISAPRVGNGKAIICSKCQTSFQLDKGIFLYLEI